MVSIEWMVVHKIISWDLHEIPLKLRKPRFFRTIPIQEAALAQYSSNVKLFSGYLMASKFVVSLHWGKLHCR